MKIALGLEVVIVHPAFEANAVDAIVTCLDQVVADRAAQNSRVDSTLGILTHGI